MKIYDYMGATTQEKAFYAFIFIASCIAISLLLRRYKPEFVRSWWKQDGAVRILGIEDEESMNTVQSIYLIISLLALLFLAYMTLAR